MNYKLININDDVSNDVGNYVGANDDTSDYVDASD
jgi:hypothetical protein